MDGVLGNANSEFEEFAADPFRPPIKDSLLPFVESARRALANDADDPGGHDS